ncbi:MAG TPA: sigma-54 dependent transcriptional regulator [Blastocatellia bacterium]|nr:sigma-54 dependent transcriptional regulator [Blastocatellia bacterium]
MQVTSMVGCSIGHQNLLKKLDRVAATDALILICGQSGVGKEMYARYVHQHSPRKSAAFVPVNCGALPIDLFENEMFGHIGGAFTGAKPQSEGLVAAAEGGTLFLDEVDSLSLICQVKLLRFIQDKEYRRLGESKIRKANLRIIAATNTNLLAAVQEGRFRDDLFFRLRVVPVEVPPLSERTCDILPLLVEYIAHFADIYGLPRIILNSDAIKRLESYAWPGNIRELENCIHYLTCLCLDRAVEPDDLPLLSGDQGEPTNDDSTSLPFNEAKHDLLSRFEREYLIHALRRSGGNIARAARASGKSRRVFFELMRKYGLKARDFLGQTVTLIGTKTSDDGVSGKDS